MPSLLLPRLSIVFILAIIIPLITRSPFPFAAGQHEESKECDEFAGDCEKVGIETVVVHSTPKIVPKHQCPQFSITDDVWGRILLLPRNQNLGGEIPMVIFYLVIIFYFFLGISIASHIFMLSIEIIVSKKRTVSVTKEEDGIMVKEQRHVKIWNDTVANLTLMALGSSAPEILLSIIETIGNDFCPGALGPGTIVGSASYNLMIITAVCIVSVPSETSKRIKEYKVFITTSAFAMFAYIWLVIIIQVVSHSYVEAWEAIITLLMFPILVLVSFWAEYNFCTSGKQIRKSSVVSTIHDPSTGLSRREMAEPSYRLYDEQWDNILDESGNVNPVSVQAIYKYLREIAVLTDEEIASIIAAKLLQSKGHSMLWYRIRAIEALMAGGRTAPTLNDKLKEVMDVLNDMKRNETGRRGDLRPMTMPKDVHKTKAVLQFTASSMAVPVIKGVFAVTIKRSGREDVLAFCRVESYDGTAKQKVTYEPVSLDFVFEPYVDEHKFHVKVVSDIHTNRDSNFFLKLILTDQNNKEKVMLGPMSTMEVILMNIDEPGEIQFTKKGKVVSDSAAYADIDVERVNGSNGPMTVKWKATPKEKCTSLAEPLEGTLTFEHGEMMKNLEIPLVRSGQRGAAHDEQFDVELVEIQGGAGKIGMVPIITVAVSANAAYKLEVTRLIEMIEDSVNMQEATPRQTYLEQIKSAFIVNGDKEEATRATKGDKIMHYISLPWKMIFCFLPTPHFLGGWPCFVFTLATIGVLTTLVGDMANIVGWCLHLDPVTTGITLVAMGTSLPDTFASRIAALQDKYADNAIGNITGSNCVNVFLGLGLPWTIASLYTEINYGEVLKVESNSLAMIVTIYTCAAIMAQIILWLRRHTKSFGAAELGGPDGTKYLTAAYLVAGWVVYVVASLMVSQNAFGLGTLSIEIASYLHVS